MSFKYINLVAIEIEGGWNTPRNDLHNDQSLKGDQFHNSHSIGEIVTKPYDDEEALFAYIKANWPTETPGCCGYHVHVSFKHINYYAKVMSKEFFAAFRKAMETWGTDYPCTNEDFWERFEGKHRFCQNDYRAEKQVKCVTKDQAREKDLRCTQLNYCYGLHKTLENRLFPTFINPNTAISATKAYLDFIEDYLEKNPISEDEIKLEIVDDNAFYQIDEKGEFISSPNNVDLKSFNLFKRKKNLYNNVRFNPEDFRPKNVRKKDELMVEELSGIKAKKPIKFASVKPVPLVKKEDPDEII